MSPSERAMTAKSSINMKPADPTEHVLIGAQSNDHSARLAGVSPRWFFTDARTFAQLQLLVTEYYRVDGLINFWDVYNIEAEALGQKVTVCCWNRHF